MSCCVFTESVLVQNQRYHTSALGEDESVS